MPKGPEGQKRPAMLRAMAEMEADSPYKKEG